ncbi:unnamed protein product [Absidia cylindrospora]
MALPLEKNHLTYTASYCEENIYLLCQYIQKHHPDRLGDCTVVFISNENETFPMWRQRASKLSEQLVVWDYHVILLVSDGAGHTGSEHIAAATVVYDFDTTLSFPCPLAEYIDKSFQPNIPLKTQFIRRYRMIPGELYIQKFASDRSHMISENGDYHAPPPTYPAIVASDGNTMSLPRYRNMALPQPSTDMYGKVVLEDSFFGLS